MARYYVQAKRRSPRNPMSSVSEYVVMDGQENCGIQGFGTRMFGEAEALQRANALRDELNGANPKQISDADVNAYIARIAAADCAAGIE
jgi:hypothetical protein